MKKNEDEIFILSVSEDIELDGGFMDTYDVSSHHERNKNASRKILLQYGEYCKNHNINATRKINSLFSIQKSIFNPKSKHKNLIFI